MLVVGLTGGIACGKTTVADLFAELGAGIVDTDIIARQLVAPGQDALNEIIRQFGQQYLTKDGQLNRAELAKLCFSNPQARQQLEAILHPRIQSEMEQQLKQLNTAYAIAVIPLLLETKRSKMIDCVLVVDCLNEQQLQRLRQRDQRSDEEIQGILNAQTSRQIRLEAADQIIENSQDLEQLKQQVQQLHNQYLQMAKNKV